MDQREKELRERLKSLKISVSRNEDGFIAASYAEPLFCFVRQDHEELKNLVADTLTAYARIFYQINLSVNIVEKPVTPHSIKVKKFTPVSNAEPVLGGMACV
jgi:hypothetical protein